MTDPTTLAPWLWLATVLFACRITGQIIAVVWAPRWLPPHGPQWMSGLVPYRWLLPAQILILSLMVAICVDFARGSGWWVVQWPRAGRIMLAVSVLYGGGMVVRYVIRMTRRPDQRWFGGTIPIVFHIVIALFLGLFAAWQLH